MCKNALKKKNGYRADTNPKNKFLILLIGGTQKPERYKKLPPLFDGVGIR